MQTELSLIIPCYNEEKNIPLIFERITAAIDFNAFPIEVILVNNGSADNSAAVLREQLQKYNLPQIKTVAIEKNKGYGYGILYGLEQAQGQVLAWTHADMQTDPADVIAAYKKYKEFKDETLLVKGKRKNRRFSELFFTFGMQVLASLALKTWLDDINAQPKLFGRSFYERYIKGSAPNDFSLDLYVLYMAKKHGKIAQIPVVFKERKFGEAKGGGGSDFKTKFKLIKRTLNYTLALARTQATEHK